MHNRALSLTQRASRSLLELAPFVSFLDSVEECGHVLPKTPQAIGPTALHSLQVPFVGFSGPLEHLLLSPKAKGGKCFHYVRGCSCLSNSTAVCILLTNTSSPNWVYLRQAISPQFPFLNLGWSTL